MVMGEPPQGSLSNILSSQLGGRVPGDPLQQSLAQLDAIAPSPAQLQAEFESLVLSPMTNPLTPHAPPPSARDRYCSVSSNRPFLDSASLPN
jgi:hypothetical protein